jgi:hypothetical protein
MSIDLFARKLKFPNKPAIQMFAFAQGIAAVSFWRRRRQKIQADNAVPPNGGT